LEIIFLVSLQKLHPGVGIFLTPQNGYTVITSDALKIIDMEGIYPEYGYCNDLLMQLNLHNFEIHDVSICSLW
jgi:hypothetical protein